MSEVIVGVGLLGLNLLLIFLVTLRHPVPENPVFPDSERDGSHEPHVESEPNSDPAYGVSDD